MKTIFFGCMMLLSLSSLALPNPAAVYCVENAGLLETRVDSSGNQHGICLFNLCGMKSECEQWAYFRRDCEPNQCLLWSVETNSCEVLP